MKDKLDLKKIRIELVSGMIIYSMFGILDYFMMPENYQLAWKLRFLIVLPYTLIAFTLTFVKVIKKYSLALCYSGLILAQLSIMAMLVAATPNEPAFYGYYVGAILMLLSCEFLYEIPFKLSVIYFLFSAVLLIIIAVLDLKLLSSDKYNYDLNWLFGNFCFFFASGVISLIGLYRLLKSRDDAQQANILKSSFLATLVTK